MKLKVQIKAGRNHLYLTDDDGNVVATTDLSLTIKEKFVSDSNDSYSTFVPTGVIQMNDTATKEWFSLGCPSFLEVDNSGNILKTFAILVGNSLIIKHFESKDDAVIYCQNHLDQSKEIIVREVKSINNLK